MNLPACPQCSLQESYQDRETFVCGVCGYEWSASTADETPDPGPRIVKDAFGTPLVSGDSVTLVKDLKVKSSSLVIKQGTKIKGIRIAEGDHEIDCKVDGTSMMLKAEFLKKA